jgi:predicted RNA-binding Zn-ribbon protein involved in translation (DUF1610 family)
MHGIMDFVKEREEGALLICKNCGNDHLKVWISVQMYIDDSDYMRLTKKAIAKKTTEIWSMDDDRTVFICPKCGWTSKSLREQKLEEGVNNS